MSGPFSKLHHLCVVVADIDRAQRFYESVGIGPWIDYPPLADYTDLDVPDPDGFRANASSVARSGRLSGATSQTTPMSDTCFFAAVMARQTRPSGL